MQHDLSHPSLLPRLTTTRLVQGKRERDLFTFLKLATMLIKGKPSPPPSAIRPMGFSHPITYIYINQRHRQPLFITQVQGRGGAWIPSHARVKKKKKNFNFFYRVSCYIFSFLNYVLFYLCLDESCCHHPIIRLKVGWGKKREEDYRDENPFFFFPPLYIYVVILSPHFGRVNQIKKFPPQKKKNKIKNLSPAS